MADERPGFVGLVVDNRVEYRRPGIDETRTYTLPQFWCLLRSDVARAQQPTYFSSSCDFPDEYGFPGDFCMREFMRAAIDDEVRNPYVRPDTSGLAAAFGDPDIEEE